MNKLFIFLFFIVLVFPVKLVTCECTCEKEIKERDKTEAFKYKLVALASILIAGAIGVSFLILGKFIAAFHPENDVFFIIKAFAAGVILATGFVHVMPDAFESLSSPCLNQNTWGSFPFSGLIAMLSGIGTMMVDVFVTSYYNRLHLNKAQPLNGDEEKVNVNDHHQQQHKADHLHVHTHAHGHGSTYPEFNDSKSLDLIRRRIISQMLELGIVVHSVVIGMSLGASSSPKTIKPLVVALTFHQLFEGMGLGSCISQAKFKAKTIVIMAIFFCLTTPVGIAIGFGISNIYDENSSTTLIVEGTLNSASAGILIYMTR